MSKHMSLAQFLKILAVTGAIVAMMSPMSPAQETRSIQLSKPDLASGGSLMQALSKRSSAREFSPEPLPVGTLSNLLWAGYGINRGNGMRTAPSAMNFQDIDIYVILPGGLYLYDAKMSQLKLIAAEDLRALAGVQEYVKTAPANLIYVSDYGKIKSGEAEDKLLLAAVETGAIVENVYLYCASEGLAAVVRASINRPALAKAMQLKPDQKIILGQTVGYPKKK